MAANISTQNELVMVDYNTNATELNRKYVEYILPGLVFYATVFITGFFANVFVLYGYTRRYPRCNFKYFVCVLAVLNLVCCLVTIPGEIYFNYRWFLSFDVILCKTKSLLNDFTVGASLAILVLITIDRFRKVCQPLKQQMGPKTTLRVCIACLLLCLVWSIPAFFLCGPQTFVIYHNDTPINVSVCIKDDKYKDTIWPILVTHVFIALPLVIGMGMIIVMYAIIFAVISNRMRKKKNMEQRLKIQTEASTPQRGPIEVDDDEDVSLSGSDVSFYDSEFPSTKDSMDEKKKKKKKSGVRRNFPIKSLYDLPKKIRKHKKGKVTYGTERRIRQKTLIMFILTAMYSITTTAYLAISSRLSHNNPLLTNLSIRQEATLMVCYRLYLLNIVVSPIVYGVLDSRFRNLLRNTSHLVSGSINRRMSSFRQTRNFPTSTVTKQPTQLGNKDNDAE